MNDFSNVTELLPSGLASKPFDDWTADDFEGLAAVVYADFLDWRKGTNESARRQGVWFRRHLGAARWHCFVRSLARSADTVLAPALGPGKISQWVEARRVLRHSVASARYRSLTDFASVEVGALECSIAEISTTLLRSLRWPTDHLAWDLEAIKRHELIDEFVRGVYAPEQVVEYLHRKIGPIVDDLLPEPETLAAGWEILRQSMITALDTLPDYSGAERGFSKALKVLVGMWVYSGVSVEEEDGDRKWEELFLRTLQVGIAWGMTYPLVDDAYDSREFLSPQELEGLDDLILRGLAGEDVSGQVPETQFFRQIFDYALQIQELIPPAEHSGTYAAITAFVRFQIRGRDQRKDRFYSERELFVLGVSKAALSRICTASLGGLRMTPERVLRFFVAAVHNQFEDDAVDFLEDEAMGAVTAFTLFGEGLLEYNPMLRYFEYNHYVADRLGEPDVSGALMAEAVTEMIRVSLTRFGADRFQRVLQLFFGEEPEMQSWVASLAKYANGINYVSEEEILLAYMDSCVEVYLKRRRRVDPTISQLTRFRDIFKPSIEGPAFEDTAASTLIAAMNHALGGSAKRIRPALAAVLLRAYGLEPKNHISLLNAIEYFHTASLIFDDLPAQDDADLRRGRSTVHRAYGEANAQLAAISLIAAGYNQLAQVQAPPEVVRELVEYASSLSGHLGLCLGQALDLKSRQDGEVGTGLASRDLETTAYLKTAVGIEFPLVSAAMVAAHTEDVVHLREYARHLGVAFQVRDDLLTLLPQSALNKSVQIDTNNKAKTFVTALGPAEARLRLNEYLDKAIGEVQNLTVDAPALIEFAEALRADARLLEVQTTPSPGQIATATNDWKQRSELKRVAFE